VAWVRPAAVSRATHRTGIAPPVMSRITGYDVSAKSRSQRFAADTAGVVCERQHTARAHRIVSTLLAPAPLAAGPALPIEHWQQTP
jgi:hypothetical protein